MPNAKGVVMSANRQHTQKHDNAVKGLSVKASPAARHVAGGKSGAARAHYQAQFAAPSCNGSCARTLD
eukprot:7946463-Alexandrium_andersonii.AAC.1